MFDIIAVGSATRDVLIESKEGTSFKLGAKIEIKKMVVTTGGGGTNYAVTFARQSLKTACIGVIGNDANGLDLITELEGEGIDASMFEKHDDDMTAYSVILVDPTGERTILSYKGEGQHFNPTSLLAKLRGASAVAKWIFLDSLGGRFDLFEGLVQYAIENNMKIACNPGGKELAHGLEKLKPLFAHMDIVLMNKEEAQSLAPDLRPFVKGILSISDGPRGVIVYDKNATYTAGIPDSPMVERTGAGDAYGSGFISEYIRSGNIEKAIQFGTANASSVVTQFGSKAGILKSGDTGPWPLVEVKVS